MSATKLPSPLGPKPNSNIPLRMPIHRQNSNSRIPVNNPEMHKWKAKFEESEIRRKSILSEKEKALRTISELERKFLDLQVKHEEVETELFERNEEFTRLKTASTNLYQEYETLKNQYETESGAMARALKDASQWYKENKELKRRTLVLYDKDTVDEGVDAGEATPDADIENLNKTIKTLSSEIAELQTELNTVKEIEFQTSEQNSKLSEDLDKERLKNKNLELELAKLKNEHEQVLRVAEMLKKELQVLRELEENQRNNVVSLRKEAEDYKKERNVLAHQSTLLMQGFESDGNNLLLIQEIEELKRTLEEERFKHYEEISNLQEKLEEQESNSQVEVLEERLKLVESELEKAVERAEKAEEALKAPPAPPPPPPPPLLPPQPPVVPLRVKRRSRVNIHDVAETLGVQNKENESESKKPAGVNEDIINAIKEGKFTLKKAKNEGKKEKDTPKAVSELLNILGSLRRAPKKRASLLIQNEVHL